MKGLLLYNLGWKLLSIALATLLWFLVAREPEVATSISVPVEFKNIPDDLDISSDIPERVHIDIRGSSGRLQRDNLANAAVVLDLSSVTGPGERTFTLSDSNLRLPVGVSFYRAIPSQITMRFERLMSKTVRIRPKYSTGPPDGYVVVSSSFDPPTARIVGPESHVQPIEYVTTDPIDLSGIVGKKEIPVHVHVGDPQVRLRSDPKVNLRVVLQKKEMN